MRSSLQDVHHTCDNILFKARQMEEFEKQTAKDIKELRMEVKQTSKALEETHRRYAKRKDDPRKKDTLQFLGKWINPNYTSIASGLNSCDLLPFLLQNQMLTGTQFDTIRLTKSHHKQAEKLLSFLKRQPESKRTLLIKSLKQSSNGHVVQYFED